MKKLSAIVHPRSEYRTLRWWNVAMAILHAAQGVVMLAVSSGFALPLTTAFVRFNAESQKLEPLLRTIGELRIGPLVAGFFFLSSLAHLAVSLPHVHAWYIANLKKGMNAARWIEYSFSSSLMIVVIAMLTGMYDAVSLLLIFSLNAMMILFGWMMELHNQTTKLTNWLSFFFGSLAGIVPWVAIAIYLIGAGSVPGFVYGIFLSLFVFFNIFALNMVLHYKKVGKWRDYLFGERVYIILSLVAKSLLAWQVWAGTLRPV
ncbi:MAG: heliorhodopsin HeR [Candidatus Kerfeldbacteria bacterium]|nr:heliorhodopsin HeR [Candidatus Kerfeldbacteria bacterium]